MKRILAVEGCVVRTDTWVVPGNSNPETACIKTLGSKSFERLMGDAFMPGDVVLVVRKADYDALAKEAEAAKKETTEVRGMFDAYVKKMRETPLFPEE